MADADGDADADVVAQLRRSVVDVEALIPSLRLSDVRLSVSANCPRSGLTDGGGHATVRPRILPALKTSNSSPTARRRRHSAASSAANSGACLPQLYSTVLTKG